MIYDHDEITDFVFQSFDGFSLDLSSFIGSFHFQLQSSQYIGAVGTPISNHMINM